MRYNIIGRNGAGNLCLKRDTLEGAIKKAGELRREDSCIEVRIVDTVTGNVVEEPPSAA